MTTQDRQIINEITNELQNLYYWYNRGTTVTYLNFLIGKIHGMWFSLSYYDSYLQENIMRAMRVISNEDI